MKTVRVGIIGVGGMGAAHAHSILNKQIRRMELTAVCDVVPAKMQPFTTAKHFASSAALIGSGLVDAVIIATPHYAHTTIGIEALKRGLHVLVEKPISVHKQDCERLIAAHQGRKQVFAAMFQMRTDNRYRKVRELVRNGELGELRRVVWVITNWFRTQAYYNSSDWRATWAGEGGGVLLNQCPHNLDLLQWMCGMPSRVRAACHFGKYHAIEVEDDVTAYFEYANGATGVFVTTTGETPGSNRLEITGDRGKVIIEHGAITFTRTVTSVKAFTKTSPDLFSTPEVWDITIPAHGGGQHADILNNFTDAILDRTPLIAPASEGIHSVELANAMLLSTWTNSMIELPLNAAKYAAHLKKLIATSTFTKKTNRAAAATAHDLSGSAAKI
jgi:predicted dehydrogenase